METLKKIWAWLVLYKKYTIPVAILIAAITAGGVLYCKGYIAGKDKAEEAVTTVQAE
jgi:hypothetical protein